MYSLTMEGFNGVRKEHFADRKLALKVTVTLHYRAFSDAKGLNEVFSKPTVIFESKDIFHNFFMIPLKNNFFFPTIKNDCLLLKMCQELPATSTAEKTNYHVGEKMVKILHYSFD